MPRVLVVGGTGLAGRAVAAEALDRGHCVVVASRRVPDDDAAAFIPGVDYRTADVVTGDGLEEALEGVDVLIDCSNGGGRAASHVFASGSLNLLHTAARFGVRRAVLLSIVNVDRSSYGYYRAKAAQEAIYRESPLEARILRSTQFHDFLAGIFARGRRFGAVTAPAKVRFQPIAVTDVARILIGAAEGDGAANSTRSIGGPCVESSRELAEQWKRATGARGPIISVHLGGGLGTSWRAGQNVVRHDAVDGLSFSDWLQTTAV